MPHEAPHAVRVPLGDRSYDVLVGPGLIARLGETLAARGLSARCALVTDSNVAPLHAAAAAASIEAAGIPHTAHVFPAGERSKSMAAAAALCEELVAAGHDRKSLLLALGGGVVGDLAGFVAAIYCRGIPFVQLPTTIVAQVDSSVGGKTGVNAEGGKNLIGAFHQPRLVLADTDTLATLPEREFREGFAEVVKHAVIRDRELFETLERLDLSRRSGLGPLVARNVAIKAAIVAADETETSGVRALLNFGHTIGHGIEQAAGYGRLLHGEAISLGTVAATRLSAARAGLPPEEAARVIALLERFGLPTRLDPDIPTGSILDALARDKKFDAGHIRFVLSPSLGEAHLTGSLTLDDLRGAVEGLRA